MLVVDGKTLDTTSLLLTVSVFSVTMYLINYLWQRRWLYYHVSKMSGPFAWPIVGNALQFAGGLDDIFETLTSHFKKYKPVYRFWLGNRLFVFLTKPEHVEIVLNKALEKEKNYHVLKYALGNGLITAPLPIWKKNRKLINPTFNQKILNGFVDTFAQKGNVLMEKLNQQSGTFDIYPFLYKCTMDQISETALGYQLDAQERGDDYAIWLTRAMAIIYGRLFKIWQLPDVLWKINPLSKELDTILQKTKVLITKIIENNREKYWKDIESDDKHNFEESRFNKTFINCMEKEMKKNGWDNDQMHDEVLTMITAGSETSASTDAYALIMMGMHPEVQEKVYQEQKKIFGDNLTEVTAEDLPKMKYLERVIKETLRLFPLAPLVMRYVEEDIDLGDFILPKGISAGVPPFAIHRDPEYWPEPLKFDPERFLPEEVAKRHPYSYIPFSAGPRNCIGLNYAMMSMKTLLSMIVRQYSVTTNYKTVSDVKVMGEIVLRCINGYNVALKRRN